MLILDRGLPRVLFSLPLSRRPEIARFDEEKINRHAEIERAELSRSTRLHMRVNLLLGDLGIAVRSLKNKRNRCSQDIS
jgi:hypothetical protein